MLLVMMMMTTMMTMMVMVTMILRLTLMTNFDGMAGGTRGRVGGSESRVRMLQRPLLFVLWMMTSSQWCVGGGPGSTAVVLAAHLVFMCFDRISFGGAGPWKTPHEH